MASLIARTLHFVNQLPARSSDEREEKSLIIQAILEHLGQHRQANLLRYGQGSQLASLPSEPSDMIEQISFPFEDYSSTRQESGQQHIENSLQLDVRNPFFEESQERSLLDTSDNDTSCLPYPDQIAWPLEHVQMDNDTDTVDMHNLGDAHNAVEGAGNYHQDTPVISSSVSFVPADQTLFGPFLASESGSASDLTGLESFTFSPNSHDAPVSEAVQHLNMEPQNPSREEEQMTTGGIRRTRLKIRPGVQNTQRALELYGTLMATSEHLKGSPGWHSLSNERALEILMATQQIMRPDAVNFIEKSYESWLTNNSLWQSPEITLPKLERQEAVDASNERLANAYLCVNALDARNEDDQIRTRLAHVVFYIEYTRACEKENVPKIDHRLPAQVLGVQGRGKTSHVIDTILRKTCPEWAHRHDGSKTSLRAKFHYINRLGKRYFQLARSLGPAVLLIASRETVALIKKPTFTDHMLELLLSLICEHRRGLVDELRPLNKVAQNIMEQQPLPDLSEFGDIVRDIRRRMESLEA